MNGNEPEANGAIEIGVKLVKGHIKTMRSALEAQVGHKIPVSHPVIAWLVTHCANILTWFTRGPDGQTAYQRVRGRVFSGKLLHFGENVDTNAGILMLGTLGLMLCLLVATTLTVSTFSSTAVLRRLYVLGLLCAFQTLRNGIASC